MVSLQDIIVAYLKQTGRFDHLSKHHVWVKEGPLYDASLKVQDTYVLLSIHPLPDSGVSAWPLENFKIDFYYPDSFKLLDEKLEMLKWEEVPQGL